MDNQTNPSTNNIQLKKRPFVLLLVIIVIVALVLIAVMYPRLKHTPLSPLQASPGHTSLSLSPITITNPASPSIIDVNINSGEDVVTGVQLELSYDPSLVENLSLQSGDFFSVSSVLPLDNTQSGKATFIITPTKLQEAKKGKGIVARVVFYPKKVSKTQSTTISLLPTSLVSGRGNKASLLKKVSNTTLILGK